MKKSYIIYDGDCGFCNRMLLFVARNDVLDAFYFVASKSVFAKKILPLSLQKITKDTVILLTKKQHYTRSLAIQKIFLQLPRYRFVGVMLAMLPLKFTDAVYRLIARYRNRFYRGDTCPTIPNDLQKKFLKDECFSL